MADGMMTWDVREEKQQISPGNIIMDGWELKRLIGRGGFGDVWLAEKSSVGILEQAAIKIIRIPRDPDEIQAMRAEGMSDQSIQAELRQSVESAVREIRVMIDLQSHPAIVQHKVFDVIQYEEDGTWEIDIRMQLLTPLADWIKASGGKTENTVRLGIALSDLLTVCERKHILHRDIKPANIFVDELGNFRLGDFGLARVISEAGSTHSKGVGTEAFMAPEVFVSGKYDHRADLYSLGLVMYWMLNELRLPFMHEGISRSKANARRLAGEAIPVLPGVDPELDRIIRKACEADPDKRWKTAKEFHDVLVRFHYKKNDRVEWVPRPEKKELETEEKKPEPVPAAMKEAEQPASPGVLPPKPKAPPSRQGRQAAVKDNNASGQGTIQQNKQIRPPEKPKAAVLKTKKRKSSGTKIAIIALLFVLIAAAVVYLVVGRKANYALYRTPGSIVAFGRYEQDNNTANGPEKIEWIVLDYDEKGHKALLLSRYGLDAKSYNTEAVDTDWEKCTLRSWLNGEFLQSAFSAKEQAAIHMTAVDNSASQGYSKWNTDGGNNTRDQIFLLSYAEANWYLFDNSDKARARVAPTAYAIANGAVANSDYQTVDGEAAGWWWLRSPGGLRNYAADVGTGGSLGYFDVRLDGIVRPAFWINLESGITPTSTSSSATNEAWQNNEKLAAAREAKYAPYRTPGSIVTFGRYEQDNNAANGPEEIEWIVLDYDEKKNKALLLSRYGLDAKSYDTEAVDTTWEKCTLRSWLNGDFLQSAFSAGERAAILKTAVDNSASQGYGKWNTDGGNNTRDQIFLLSYAEANRYLFDNSDKASARVAPTAYAIASGAVISSDYQTADGEAAGWWWLRSPGGLRNYAADVGTGGSLGYFDVRHAGTVRPAFWLNLKSSDLK